MNVDAGAGQDVSFPSRVVIEMQDGERFATFWSNRAVDSEVLPLGNLFTGRLIARIVGSETHLPSGKIEKVFEEVARTPEGNPYRRVMLQRRAPNKTPERRSLLPGAAKFADHLTGMTLERVDAIIDNPAETWPGWNGATVYSDGEFQVVVGERWSDTDCVMSISRDDPNMQGSRMAPVQDRRRVSGQKADRRPVPTGVSEFLERLEEYGFEVDDSRRHYSVSHPKRPGVNCPIPRTPSDHRWSGNLVSQIRQMFDIDIREPLN